MKRARAVWLGPLAALLLPACGDGGGGGAPAGPLPTLDAGFDNDGVRQVDVSGIDDWAFGIALQADGKIVVAGRAEGSTTDFAVVRLLADGALDPTFDGDGIRTTNIAGLDTAFAVAVQPDGKIVVAGSAGLSAINEAFAVVRYLPDGTPDATFDGDGIRTDDLSPGIDRAYALVIQPDGKIVLGGTGPISGDDDFVLVRYDANGVPDAGFGTAGVVSADLGSVDLAAGLALQADGKLVLGGWSSSDFAVARFEADGDPDPTFDTDGVVVTDVAGGGDTALTVALQPDGKILVGGHANVFGIPDFAVLRFLTDGSLDSTFDGDGRLTFDPEGVGDFGAALAVRADGRIALVGNGFSGGSEALFVARFLADGTPDVSFDGDGSAVVNPTAGDEAGRAAVFQPDGKLVIAGRANTGAASNFVVARFNP